MATFKAKNFAGEIVRLNNKNKIRQEIHIHLYANTYNKAHNNKNYMTSLSHIEVNLEQVTSEDRKNNSRPKPLSRAGLMFWKFLHDREVAHGNDPRNIIRSQLIATFRENLRAIGSPLDECLMEEDHGYIQWFFPLDTMGVNPEAPIVRKKDHETLRANENLRTKMYEHFLLFAEFMGITYQPENGTFKKTNANQWNNWIRNGHNNLRITRILISLKNFGLEQLAREFLVFLKYESHFDEADEVDGQRYIAYNKFTKSSCDHYWSNAVDQK